MTRSFFLHDCQISREVTPYPTARIAMILPVRRLFFLLLGCFTLAAGDGSDHTNTCIQNLGGLLACQSIFNDGIGQIPSNIQTCCNGLRDVAVDLCECNPTVNILLGDAADLLFGLEPVCRILQPFQWFRVPRRRRRNCADVETYEYGCALPDKDVDGLRYQSITAFNDAFAGNLNDDCLQTEDFVRGLDDAFVENGTFTVP